MNRLNIYRLTLVLLMIDQIIKIVINHTMKLYQEIKIIPNFFSILYVKNTGAAFSVLENRTILLISISVIFVLLLDKYIQKEQNTLNKIERLSYGMILGGIFGNLIDRIIHRGVIDYLSFTFGKYDFAIFNFADICIVLGTIILIGNTWFSRKKEK